MMSPVIPEVTSPGVLWHGADVVTSGISGHWGCSMRDEIPDSSFAMASRPSYTSFRDDNIISKKTTKEHSHA